MSNLFDRMKLLVQRDKEFRSALYGIMGFYPHNVELYRIAFAHKSQEYKSKKTGDRPLNNERLEFLGDAVLETVVSDIVYHHFKHKREGFLTNTRSKIVSRESLGKLAKDLGIDRLIQSHTTGHSHNSFLAGNAFEALMGAIYLDRGFDYAFRFIEHRIMGSVLDLEGVAHKEVNFKSKLLEWSQKNRIRIEFKDKQTGNSGNAPSFSTTIILEGLFAGDGRGFSKKEAHQNAAKDALTRMRREPKFIDDIFSAKESRTAMEADPCFVLPVIDEIEADIAREAEQKERKPQKERKSKKEPQPQREQQSKKEQQPKKEQPQKEQQPKKEQPQKEPQPKKEQPQREQQSKKELPQREQQPSAAKTAAIVEPIVVEISLDDVSVEAPEVAKSTIKAAKPTEAAYSSDVVNDSGIISATEAASTSRDPASLAAPDTLATPVAPATEGGTTPKKSRRRGKRQNAAGFTNTEVIAAETSHRAEKAAAKVEEAKREKARRIGKKTAKIAAKGIQDEPSVKTEASAKAGTSTKTAKNGTSAKGEKDAKGAKDGKPVTPPTEDKPKVKKPRRRKTKAELPSETPNPEREKAISTAEDAAYQQMGNEE